MVNEKEFRDLKRKLNFLEKNVSRAEKLAAHSKLDKKELLELNHLPSTEKKLRILNSQLQKMADSYADIEQKNPVDAKQNAKLKFLKKELENLLSLVPSIFERLQEIMQKVPSLRRKITNVQREVERPEFYKKRKLFLKVASEKFKDYSSGIKRLNKLERELDLLDTRKFKRQEKAIRKKLKDVSLIPQIEQDIKELKLRIAGFDLESAKAIIDKEQERKIKALRYEDREIEAKVGSLKRVIGLIKNQISKVENLARKKPVTRKEAEEIKELPNLKRKLSTLVAKEKEDQEKIESFEKMKGKLSRISASQKEVEQTIEDIPALKRRTGFLGRLFKKDSGEIERIESKVDEKTLEFYDRLTKELSESRRMIEEEKLELRKQLFDVLAESLRQINQEKENSDKKILDEIEKLKAKISEDKQEVNENVISKIVQLKSKLEESKTELQKETEKQISLLKKKLDEDKSSENFQPAIHKPAPTFVKKAFIAEKIHHEEVRPYDVFSSNSISSPFFPEMPKLPELPPKNKSLKPVQLSPSELKKAVFAAEKIVEKKNKQEVPKEKPVKIPSLRIPSKKFFEHSRFQRLKDNILEIEKIVSVQKKQLSVHLDEDLSRKEIEKCVHNSENLINSIKEVNARLFSNIK